MTGIKANSIITVNKSGKYYGYYGTVVAIIDESVMVSLGGHGVQTFLLEEIKPYQDVSVRSNKDYPEW